MQSSSVWANAQPVVTDEQMNELRQIQSSDLRNLAASQIKKAWEAYDKATEIKVWQGIGLNWIQYGRFKDVIKNADENFEKADKESEETRKRDLYIYAWRTAKIAASNIAEEAQLNPTIYHAWVRPAFEYVDKKLTEVKDNIDTANKFVIASGIVAAAIFIFQQSKK